MFSIAIIIYCFFFFQAEDGIRDLVRSRGLGDVYKRQGIDAGRELFQHAGPEHELVAHHLRVTGLFLEGVEEQRGHLHESVSLCISFTIVVMISLVAMRLICLSLIHI